MAGLLWFSLVKVCGCVGGGGVCDSAAPGVFTANWGGGFTGIQGHFHHPVEVSCCPTCGGAP